MSTGTINIPISRWNKQERRIERIESALTNPIQSTAGFVGMGRILKECPTITPEKLRGIRKNQPDLCLKKESGRYLYNLEGIKKCA